MANISDLNKGLVAHYPWDWESETKDTQRRTKWVKKSS